MKQCRKCSEFKPTERFYYDKGTADKLSNRCKDCKREYDRQHRKLPHVKAYNAESQRRRNSNPEKRAENRERRRIWALRKRSKGRLDAFSCHPRIAPNDERLGTELTER